MLIDSKKKVIVKTNCWSPCFLLWRGNWLLSVEGWDYLAALGDAVVVTVFVVKENSAQVSFLVCICIEILETFWFQISKLFIFRLYRRLFFWRRQRSVAFLSCLFWDCRVGWLSLLISFRQGRGFWTCLKQKPRTESMSASQLLPGLPGQWRLPPSRRIALGGGLFRS